MPPIKWDTSVCTYYLPSLRRCFYAQLPASVHHKQAPFLATYSSASLHTASTSQVATCMQEIGERGCWAISPFGLGEIWIFPLGTQMCSLFCGVVSHFYHLSAPYLSKLLFFLANWESCEQSWHYFQLKEYISIIQKTENGKSANTKIKGKSVTQQKEKTI